MAAPTVPVVVAAPTVPVVVVVRTVPVVVVVPTTLGAVAAPTAPVTTARWDRSGSYVPRTCSWST
ncbi:hypothetical protein [Streptomyces sp. NPDC059787]|uniref:hypothetical protein n=1 Tax=Streptomyces sp. NPDC059787 TaxID=3346947 RepID=UPI0036466D36